MRIEKLSDSVLEMLSDAVHKAFYADEESRKAGRELKYVVREFADWREWSDRIDAEMQRRNLLFDELNW